MPTLVMMHGMTGSTELMQGFAEKILPAGWDLMVPQASFTHPKRGYTWWRYEDEKDDPGRRILNSKELDDIDVSLLRLKDSLPDDMLVLGGFSQGGAMAQELLQFDLDVIGIIAIGTRAVRPLELKMRLEEISARSLFWMHGEEDHRVSIESGAEIAELFEQANWDVTRVQHQKGHMIPIEFHFSIKKWLESLV